MLDQVALSDAQLFAPLEYFGVERLHLASKLLEVFSKAVNVFGGPFIHLLLPLQLLNSFVDGPAFLIFYLTDPPLNLIEFGFIVYLVHSIYKNINKMYSSLYDSKHKSIFDSPSKKYKIEPRRMESFRKSVRKPIFENSTFYTGSKPKNLSRWNSSTDQIYDHIQFQPSVHDDFCGCEHNLVPCSIIKELLVGLN